MDSSVAREDQENSKTRYGQTGYALDSGSPNRWWLAAEQPGGLGDLGVGGRAGIQCLLHETEKELSPALGFSPVKAKRKLVEVVRQMLV